MSKFKKGDKIRRVTACSPEALVKQGGEYTISKVRDGGTLIHLKELIFGCYYASNFELVTNEEPLIGAIDE